MEGGSGQGTMEGWMEGGKDEMWVCGSVSE